MSVGLRVEGLSEFDSAVDAWFGAVEKATSEAAVGLAHEVFEQILETSPQYSGDFTANTKISVGAPDTSFTPDIFPNTMKSPFHVGSSPAQEYAKANAHWTTPALGQSIFISSSAKHDDWYAWLIENGQIKLRPENYGATKVYSRAVNLVSHNYTHIGSPQLDWLRKNAE